MATSSQAIPFDGGGKLDATYSISEDAVTKQILRSTLNTSAGVEIGIAAAPLITSGAVADNAADSGNPLKVGGVYNSSQPTLDSGDRGNLQLDVNGNLRTVLQSTISGEDVNNDVMKVEQQMSIVRVTADTQVKGTSGFVHTVTFACPAVTTPTAGVITIYDSAAESGTAILTMYFAAAYFLPFTVTLNGTCNTGIYVGYATVNNISVTVSYR